MEISDLLSEKTDLINNYLLKYLPDSNSYQSKIFEAIKYSVFAGGKRLRPILMLLAYECFNGEDVETIMPFCCSVEMIHTYSLIHDDLPAMDNDDYRRGKLTNHKVFGEDMAILAGDGLLNLAYETMIEASIKNKTCRALKAMKVLAKAAGVYGMVAGQVVDLEAEKKVIDKKELNFIHEKKTAELIEAPLKMGAILSSATDEEIYLIGKAGYLLGMAFQIQDDILDVIGDEATLGKSVNSDAKNEKSTFVSLYGLDESKKYVQKYSKEAEEIFKSFKNGQNLVNLTNYLVNRQY